MSKKGDELYVRKSKSSKLEADNQIWDDSLITAAYDRAMNKANDEIAKQIAMATNSMSNAAPNQKGKSTTIPKPVENSPPKVWQEGMPCRAVFFEDGLEYEAVVYAILDREECVVKFLGYENSEVVNLDSLLESRGDESRIRQIEQATGDKYDDGFESQSNEEISVSGVASSAASVRSNQSKKKAPKKKKAKKPKVPNFPNMPNLADFVTMNDAFAGPAMSDLRLPSIPFPPPPLADLPISEMEQQALSSMLISWYMSGYHTGLYQGLLGSKKNNRSRN